MLLTELHDQMDSPVEFNFDMAKYNNNSDELTYRVTNLPVNGNVVSDAGTVALNVNPEDFVQKVEEASDDGVGSIDGVRLARPLPNFKCRTSQCSDVFTMDSSYTLDVVYTTNSGKHQKTQVTFNGSAFEPSEELINSQGA